MKNSGIKWIGEIPDDWEQTRLKNLFIDRCGGAWGDEAQDNEYDRICIRVADIDFEKQTIKAGDKTIRNYQSKVIDKLTLRENDLLIEKSGGGEKMPVGRTILATECPGVLFANFIDRLRIRTSQNAKFIAYLFRALYNNGITLSYIKKTTGIQNLDVENLLSEVVYTPRTEYQHSIAIYLDKKCAEIDRLIAHEEAMIDELKAYKQSVITEAVTKGLDRTALMKDSGVEWIGEIPEDWKVSRIKYFCKIINGFPFDSNDFGRDLSFKVVRIGDIQNDTVDWENCVSVSINNIKNCNLRKGDAIIALSGATVGKTAFINDEIKDCYINQRVAIIRSTHIKYILYTLKTIGFAEYVTLSSSGSAQPNLSTGQMGNYYLLVSDKQDLIVHFLERKCSEIDRLISLKHAKIEELRDYKKSLIYEYVTGKKEVMQ